MAEQLYKIRGTRGDLRTGQFGNIVPTHRLIPGAARDGASDEVEVPGNTVVRVELDNGRIFSCYAEGAAQHQQRAWHPRTGHQGAGLFRY